MAQLLRLAQLLRSLCRLAHHPLFPLAPSLSVVDASVASPSHLSEPQSPLVLSVASDDSDRDGVTEDVAPLSLDLSAWNEPAASRGETQIRDIKPKNT